MVFPKGKEKAAVQHAGSEGLKLGVIKNLPVAKQLIPQAEQESFCYHTVLNSCCSFHVRCGLNTCLSSVLLI